MLPVGSPTGHCRQLCLPGSWATAVAWCCSPWSPSGQLDDPGGRCWERLSGRWRRWRGRWWPPAWEAPAPPFGDVGGRSLKWDNWINDKIKLVMLLNWHTFQKQVRWGTKCLGTSRIVKLKIPRLASDRFWPWISSRFSLLSPARCWCCCEWKILNPAWNFCDTLIHIPTQSCWFACTSRFYGRPIRAKCSSDGIDWRRFHFNGWQAGTGRPGAGKMFAGRHDQIGLNILHYYLNCICTNY